MSKVKVLPSDIVAKIAAGEVIERPASVIKELVENSLDAGATEISVRLKDAGKKLITIKDNGCGIEKDDLENIFLRHATSKITNADDLFDIHSLGFRGEALYSIGAIADVTLKSKTNEQPEGWEIHLRGGEKLDLTPCATNQTGTEIEIQELFFNTPARKKFLKSNTAEINQVLNIFIPYTILYPNIRFQLNHQNKDLIQLNPASERAERVTDVLNLEQKHLITTQKSLPGDLTIELVLGDINIKRTRRDMQFIYVNGRPVQSKNISFHMNQIYRLIMAPQEFPFFVVNISMPADELDVNIHPAKREVKMKNEQHICSILRRLTEDTLMSKGQVKVVDVETIPAASTESLKSVSSPSDNFDVSSPTEFTSSTSQEDYSYPRANTVTETVSLFENSVPLQTHDNSLQTKFENATYIGQFMHKFLLFEIENALLVVDQHAAQERIMYEHFIKQMNKGDLQVQNLLSPVLIKLTPQELAIWEERKELIQDCGFDNNQWDAGTIAVHSHPSLIYDVEKSVRSVLAGEEIQKSDHDTLARRACKASIRAGDKLTAAQAEHQREQLLQCKDPFTCPHGRPTIIELTESFLDKQFLRT